MPQEPILLYETEKFKFWSKLKRPAIESSFFLTLYVFIKYDIF